MKFLLANDVPDALSYLLRELGHDVSLLRELIPRTLQTQLSCSFGVQCDGASRAG